MTARRSQALSALAILTFAEIKAATETFDSGESNLFDALDAIAAAIEAYQAAALPRRQAA